MELNSTDEKFPQIEDVVPKRMLVAGIQFLYAKAGNVKEFHDDGWRHIANLAPLEVDGEVYMVMWQGVPVGTSEPVVPRTFVNVVGDAA